MMNNTFHNYNEEENKRNGNQENGNLENGASFQPYPPQGMPQEAQLDGAPEAVDMAQAGGDVNQQAPYGGYPHGNGSAQPEDSQGIYRYGKGSIPPESSQPVNYQAPYGSQYTYGYGVYGGGDGNGGGNNGNGGSGGNGGGNNGNGNPPDYGNNQGAGGDPEDSGRQAKKHGGKRRVVKWVAAAMAGVLVLGGAAGGGVYVGTRLADKQNQVVAEADQDASGELQLNEGSAIGSTDTGTGVETVASTSDVSEVVANVMPSIVAINCTAEYVANFWGQQFTQESQGSGSGIIIGQNKEEVLIATNNHVVASDENARNASIEVVFDNGTSAPATVKGTEEGSDLAVVSVKLSDLDEETLSYIKIATLGDSDSLKVGQMAIAIGNALGYGQSTTVGYISALNREVMTEDYTMSLIQTDAAINPGNSGGALLNIKGEVIGINSAKYSDQAVEGMGFAIPISDAIPIINDLMNREEIPEEEQAYLGIIGQDVTAEYNEHYGMPIGVYVYQVSADSPAEQAGLKMGDVITQFNGRKVSTMSDMQRILATYRGGEEITLTVQSFQDGSYTENTLHVTLGYKNR